MSKITTPPIRKIIDDFEEEIKKRKRPGSPPKKTVIDFRNERANGIERDIEEVPIELLRYRKDNGRISSDVLHYERIHGLLDETDDEAQNIIKRFLEDKDKEKTEELKRSIFHSGQREPAIITTDGFLINGNRRKMVLSNLLKEHPGEDKFSTMKVVILPGKDDPGGPPTLLEIEQIENRYQLQKEAKAEYYAFDRALSIRRKIELGMSLEEQLRDDPVYGGLGNKEFKKEMKKIENEYLGPLDCIERYLDCLDRSKLYSTVSRGVADPEGRWQAFLDYYQKVYLKINDDKKRLKLGLKENEKGKVEDAAFKIIRKRKIKGMPKAHKIIRDLPKYLECEDSRKEIFKLNHIDLDIAEEERYDKNGKELDEREVDKVWSKKNETEITRYVNRAKNYFYNKKIRETCLDLLDAAFKKLNHKDMVPSTVPIDDIKEAMELAKKIKKRADELESEFYWEMKKLKDFKKNFSA
ncbi:MAG: hypothetical protein ACTSRG_23625 [Candidatus Helarchaeota archaeon]